MPGWCLAGIVALALCTGVARAAIPGPDPNDAVLAATFDAPQQARDTAPTTATAEPSTGPLLPAIAPASQEDRMQELPREGEIVPLEETRRGPLTFSLTLLYMYGGVIGQLQTPVAHATASTSANRPTFDEIGISDANIGDGEFGVGWDNQQIFFGAQYNHMSGSSTLGRSLVSGGVTFPAHTHVNSDVRMDWYRLGYRYTFVLDTAPNNVPDLTLTPMIDAFYWDYGYSLDAGRIGHAGNSLQRWGFQLGGTFAWRPYGGRFSIEANLAAFPQNQRLATISTESVIMRYRFYQWRRYDFNVLLGVAWEQQYYNDHKVGAPNKISADFGTMLLTGIQMNF
jgi:hypothetical protein